MNFEGACGARPSVFVGGVVRCAEETLCTRWINSASVWIGVEFIGLGSSPPLDDAYLFVLALKNTALLLIKSLVQICALTSD